MLNNLVQVHASLLYVQETYATNLTTPGVNTVNQSNLTILVTCTQVSCTQQSSCVLFDARNFIQEKTCARKYDTPSI